MRIVLSALYVGCLTDISGVTPRVINGIPDIGAFEYPLVPGMLLLR